MINAIGGVGSFDTTTFGSTNAAAAKARAEASEFSQMLKALQDKAEQATRASDDVQTVQARIDAARAKERAAREKQLRDACEGFEAMFLGIMYKEMRNTVPKNELFGDDNAYEIWQSMLDTELANRAAKDGGVGIANLLYQQLSPQVLAEPYEHVHGAQAIPGQGRVK